jgi:single-stranded DNA-binding protein
MLNSVKVIGETTGVFVTNHSFKGKNGKVITALETEIIYTSANMVSNVIKVIFYKNSLFEELLSKKGKMVSIEGTMRTFNKNAWGKRISEVFLSPKQVTIVQNTTKQKNVVELKGEICGNMIFKKRLSGKLVAEVKVRVERENGQYDYIPLVAFDDNARLIQLSGEGKTISIKGRIHSRTFNFKYEENRKEKVVVRTALEIGVHNISYDLNSKVTKSLERTILYSLLNSLPSQPLLNTFFQDYGARGRKQKAV